MKARPSQQLLSSCITYYHNDTDVNVMVMMMMMMLTRTSSWVDAVL